MSDKNRFAMLKENTFKKPSSDKFKPRESSDSTRNNTGTNRRFNMGNSSPQSNNRYSRESSDNTRNKFRRGKYRNNRPMTDLKNSKFRQIGRGEVTFIPQVKKKEQKEKKEKKEPKIEPVKNYDFDELEKEKDMALTLAMAQKYMYHTESEEEDEEGEEGEEEVLSASQSPASILDAATRTLQCLSKRIE